MRKNKEGEDEVVFDMKTVPFVKNLKDVTLKNIRLSPDHTKVIKIKDLYEKYTIFILLILTLNYVNLGYFRVRFRK